MRVSGSGCGVVVAAAVGVLISACSNGPSPLPSLTTGSLFGSSDAKKAAAANLPKAPADTPSNRGFQVGSVSARAQKCGFHFDAAKLKSEFLTAEARGGGTPEELAQAEKTYNVGYGGIAKAVAGKSDYCSEKKTKEIKADLALLLAGNYAPQALRPKEEEDDGLFSFGSPKPESPIE